MLNNYIITFMVIKKVKGGLLLGIFATWLLGCLCQLAGIYVPDPAAGFGSMFPSGIVSAPAEGNPEASVCADRRVHPEIHFPVTRQKEAGAPSLVSFLVV